MRAISLRTSLGLLLAAATLLSFTFVATIILLVRLPQVEERAREQAQSMAVETNRLVDSYMESVELQLQPLAHLIRNRNSHADRQELLQAIVDAGGTFDSLVVVDPQGRVEAYGLPKSRVVTEGISLRGLDLMANRLYVDQLARMRQAPAAAPPLWSDTYLSVLSGQMTVGVALAAGSRMIIGELSQERILALMKNVGYTDQAVVMVLDRKGRRLATTNATPAVQTDFGGYPAFQAIARGAAVPEYEYFMGRPLLVGGVVSSKLGWVFAVVMPAGMNLYSYRLTVLIVIFGYLGSLSVSLLLAPVWAARLARPFKALTEKAHRIASGDYAGKAEPISSIVEFNRLATDLDGMERSIRERERAMQRSEAQLKATLEAAPAVAIQWFDIEGRVLYWNPASAELYGHSAEEAIGCRITDKLLMYASLAQARVFVDLLGDMARTGEPYGPAEYELRHKDGTPVIVLATTFVLPGDDHQPVFVCMDVDITQRKQAEQALLTNELKLETIFNASPAPMSVSDASDGFRVISVNQAWERLYRRGRADVLERRGSDFGFWSRVEDRDRFLQLVQSEGQVKDMEFWCVDGEGRRILCLISALITRIGDQHLLLMMSVDITERRRIEQELQLLNTELELRVETRTEELRLANQQLESSIENLKLAQSQLVESEKLAALGNLVAGIAHELNTPIGNGLMAISTLNERALAFQQVQREGLRYSDLQRFTEAVEMACSISLRNLQKAAALVSSFKQIAVDQTSSQRRRFELLEVVDEVLLTLQPTLRKTPWRVEVHVPPGLNLDSYPGALGQVLTNLVSNAVMHAFDGRTSGTITVTGEDGPGSEILLRVQDDGKGIPAALQKKIFEPFFTTKMGQGGTGLGLHIVFNAVTRVLGGRITLRSESGQGSVFELYLPRVAPGSEAPQGPGQAAPERESA